MTSRTAWVPAALLGASIATGCGHTETHVAMLRAAQAPTGKPVELYLADKGGPARPVYDIAIVQAVGFGNDANPEDITHALTQQAAALGCDAVVRVSIDLGYSRAHAAGVCVKYLAEGPAAPPPVLPEGRGKNPSPPATRPAPAPRIEPLPSDPNPGR